METLEDKTLNEVNTVDNSLQVAIRDIAHGAPQSEQTPDVEIQQLDAEETKVPQHTHNISKQSVDPRESDEINPMEESVITFISHPDDTTMGEKLAPSFEAAAAAKYEEETEILEITPGDQQIDVPFQMPGREERSPTITDKELNVQITVSDPVMQSTGIGKHVEYVVRGSDEKSSFESVRRYREFIALRQRLVDSWPGVFIPAIPPKQAIGNKKDHFIEKRRKLLNEFAMKTAKTSHLYQSEEFQVFLRGPPNFHKSKMQKAELNEIYDRYKESFESFTAKEVTEEIKENLKEEYDSFKKMLGTLQANETNLTRMVNMWDRFTDHFVELTTTMFSFEHAVQTTYDITPVFQDPDVSENPYIHLQDWIRIEMLDIQALLETFDRKENMVLQKTRLEKNLTEKTAAKERLAAGQKSLKAFFSKKSKEAQADEIEDAITALQSQIDQLNFIIHVIVLRLYELEIPRFKKSKGDNITKIIKDFAFHAHDQFQNRVLYFKKLIV